MKRKIVLYLLSFILCPSSLWAKNDSIYGGTQIKLDIASPIIVPASNGWQIQHYETAVNVRLKDRFYPTLELGYAGGKTSRGDTLAYHGKGGFFRVGADINPLKKHPDSPHALLIGVRLGTSVQDYSQALESATGLRMKATGVKADCWGEIVAGCQVEVYKGKKHEQMALYMGWMGRLKCLFTRKTDEYPYSETKAVYIPGFGKRDNIGWGVDYYFGWKL